MSDPVRMSWSSARADSPVRAAWRQDKQHPKAVSDWLWIVAPDATSEDGWWPVVAFRIYAGFGTVCPLQSSALYAFEDWQPVVPGTVDGDKYVELVRRVTEGKLEVRPVDPENESKFFVLSRSRKDLPSRLLPYSP